jgi:hypothetical protein
MANFTQLRDFYSFPGFTPATHIHGVFGDPYAVVIPLRRHQKKRPVEYVGLSTALSTINPSATSVTSIAAGGASTSNFSSAASPAARVGP